MRKLLLCLAIGIMLFSGCCTTDRPRQAVQPSQSTELLTVTVADRATKIEQLVGDFDRERGEPTKNLTFARYKLLATDLGVPFKHNGRTYLLFGDTWPQGDAIGYTTDTTPEDGIDLDFVSSEIGAYKPVSIPGVSQGGFEVPMEGTSVGGKMYIYYTTDHSSSATMGRSIVAVSDDNGKTFKYLYDLSTKYFINVSVVEAKSADWPELPQDIGEMLVIFGSGEYRKSNVYLAFQPAVQIESPTSIRYHAGMDQSGRPILSNEETDAKPLFDQPTVGELSVTYNPFIHKWIMLYNSSIPQWRGINMRTADQPWGPWSEPQIIFHPWDNNGYCHFMHTSWDHQKCDNVHDPGRENEWGGEYGPYQFEGLAIGDQTTTTIYFTMSTWNPYTVVLMKATLQTTK